jgi:hypothetical protein
MLILVLKSVIPVENVFFDVFVENRSLDQLGGGIGGGGSNRGGEGGGQNLHSKFGQKSKLAFLSQIYHGKMSFFGFSRGGRPKNR